MSHAPLHRAASPSEARSEVAVRAYRGVWRLLAVWFKLPQEPPSLPIAPGDVADSFHPSPAFLRYLKFRFWIALLIIDVVLVVLWIAATVALYFANLTWVAVILAPVALAIIVVPDIVAYVAIHLRFDTTWYVMSRRSLRVRQGVWSIRELTLTFENVQNVRVVQGPLQRFFGLATVMVETAGGGSVQAQGQPVKLGHHALIEGLTNAQEIRDLILARVTASRSAGIGDDRVPVEAPMVSRDFTMTSEQLAVLRAIRDELRAAAAA
ncbi:MAG: PH domain-containing protein [Phycisphaeraceae bacterium]|nr:PH domain-containing protein [Phycisphaeraceae bacterium]